MVISRVGQSLWIAGGFYTSTTSTQWCKTAGNFVNITQVQLEQGAIATPFEQRPIGLELALCQRYFEVLRLSRIIVGAITNENYITWLFKVVKRIDPSIVLGAGSACTVQNLGPDGVSAFGANASFTVMSTGTTANAEYF